ncbi:lactate racemase domain-containing protein [Georgenia sp. TF02-10]|uniref:lactate racemase domain-containing protein n=1 Tax=Georgenia sp. TF02-10 TaxID=2917725 RepID=UPI001FA6D012|nr:lactate racemase domain-containing protein [Georgenia sp. TF02-10]UNX54647.1 lactate racemase domain-containing protein [Georgenia sp. TF02-10]
MPSAAPTDAACGWVGALEQRPAGELAVGEAAGVALDQHGHRHGERRDRGDGAQEIGLAHHLPRRARAAQAHDEVAVDLVRGVVQPFPEQTDRPGGVPVPPRARRRATADPDTVQHMWFQHESRFVDRPQIEAMCQRLLVEARERLQIGRYQCVLLLPPDLTRAHSGAGWITEHLYRLLDAEGAEVHVIPTLGQHVPHTPEENRWMFGSIPEERIHAHHWKTGVTNVGTVPADVVREKTGGAVDWEIPVDLNIMLVTEPWDLVINIGHVVPHEVLGFANHNKNYFIGLGGKRTLGASHMASAVYGIENNLGNLLTPVRACFNYAEEHFLADLPDVYLQVVMDYDDGGRLRHTGVYVGDDLETYLAAARASREQNITVFDEPVRKVVAVMQADEFRATWVANKAVYRTRMAIADGGELLVIAPGVERFGEQPEVDALIRKYGYLSQAEVIDLYRTEADMQDIPHGTAHLVHGSAEGRFTITYAPGMLSRAEIESVGYRYLDLAEAQRRYDPEVMTDGWNTMPDGEEVFYISTPSAGLWATREKLEQRAGHELHP